MSNISRHCGVMDEMAENVVGSVELFHGSGKTIGFWWTNEIAIVNTQYWLVLERANAWLSLVGIWTSWSDGILASRLVLVRTATEKVRIGRT